jgi:hypothetical protein
MMTGSCSPAWYAVGPLLGAAVGIGLAKMVLVTRDADDHNLSFTPSYLSGLQARLRAGHCHCVTQLALGGKATFCYPFHRRAAEGRGADCPRSHSWLLWSCDVQGTECSIHQGLRRHCSHQLSNSSPPEAGDHPPLRRGLWTQHTYDCIHSDLWYTLTARLHVRHLTCPTLHNMHDPIT